MRARYEIHLENYSKVIGIEALTMLDMVKRDILPAMSKYASVLSSNIAIKRAALGNVDCSYETSTAEKLSSLTGEVYKRMGELEAALAKAKTIADSYENAKFVKDSVLETMSSLRAAVDEAETLVSAEYWPFPTYTELLFGVR